VAEQITYLIIGNGIAGVTAAEVLRSEDSSARIGVIADDPFPVYYRPALKDYLAGRVQEDKLWARSTSFYQDQNVLFLPDRVAMIQPRLHSVQLQSGKQVSYSKLLLASGASPARLTCPGVDLHGVWTLRTISDYQEILQHLNAVRRVVVSGSGTLALESVETLRHRGFQVTHLVRRTTVWSEVLDATASDLVLQQERRDGVDVRLEEEIAEITGTRGEVSGVITKGGQRIPCEMVLIAIGVTPNIDFIRASGIACWRGVRVNPAMQTNAPDIYAAGDVLEITDPLSGRTRVLGQWFPAIQQARAAAYSMLDLLESETTVDRNSQSGQSEQPPAAGKFSFANFYNATILYGLDFASAGLTNVGTGDGFQELVADPQPRVYRKVLLKDGIAVGALALGDRKQVLSLKRAIDYRINLTPVVRRLFAPDFNLAAWLDAQGVPPALLSIRRSGETEVRQAVTMTQQKVEQEKQKQAGKMEDAASPQAGQPVEGEEIMVKPSSSARQEALLVQVIKPGQIQRFPETLLSQTSVFTIGRQAGVHLLIDEASVSRRHAEISYSGDFYVLRDLGSTNGTFVNSTRLEPSRPYVLQTSDMIRFGNVVTFKFLLRTLASNSRPALTDSSPGLSMQYDVQPGPTRASQGLPVLNPDGSLMPPGATKAVSASIVQTFREMPALIILPEKGANKTATPRVYQLRPGKAVSIGREESSDIVLADVVVSRRHAEIMPGPTGGFYLRDLGSSNGVYVNATKLTNPYQLKHGDRIRMGSTMIFFVDLQAGIESTLKSPAIPSTSNLQKTPDVAVEQKRENPSGETTTIRQAVPILAGIRSPEVLICQRCGIANMRVARFCAGCSAPLLAPEQ
jgi:pSer/pThr/pTyr-binding forkhead associated (FHA) protein/NADPH-dependent 2,4-dienoyl-CoA reductase/sulfur reductase-like enzyme